MVWIAGGQVQPLQMQAARPSQPVVLGRIFDRPAVGIEGFQDLMEIFARVLMPASHVPTLDHGSDIKDPSIHSPDLSPQPGR